MQDDVRAPARRNRNYSDSFDPWLHQYQSIPDLISYRNNLEGYITRLLQEPWNGSDSLRGKLDDRLLKLSEWIDYLKQNNGNFDSALREWNRSHPPESRWKGKSPFASVTPSPINASGAGLASSIPLSGSMARAPVVNDAPISTPIIIPTAIIQDSTTGTVRGTKRVGLPLPSTASKNLSATPRKKKTRTEEEDIEELLKFTRDSLKDPTKRKEILED